LGGIERKEGNTGRNLREKMMGSRKRKRAKLRWKSKRANHGKGPGMGGKK